MHLIINRVTELLFAMILLLGADSQKIFTQITKRIYVVLNSLVNNNSGKNEERYRLYQDKTNYY